MHSPSSRLVLPRCAVLGRALRDGAGDFVSHKGTKARRGHWGFLRKAGRHEWAHRGTGIFIGRSLETGFAMEGQGPGFIPALGIAQGFRTRTSKGLKARLHFSPCTRTLDRAFSPLAISDARPRPSLVPRFDLGWYGPGRWPSIAHFCWKGMKVPLHEGLPPLCVLGALVVKDTRRCGVDWGGKFYPKCDDPVPQCSVQRGASRYEADRCGVQRGGSRDRQIICILQGQWVSF